MTYVRLPAPGPGWYERILRRCRRHGDRLVRETSRVTWYWRSTQHDEAARAGFPNAFSFPDGRARIAFCPSCRDAERAWLAAHPEHEPVPQPGIGRLHLPHLHRIMARAVAASSDVERLRLWFMAWNHLAEAHLREDVPDTFDPAEPGRRAFAALPRDVVADLLREPLVRRGLALVRFSDPPVTADPARKAGRLLARLATPHQDGNARAGAADGADLARLLFELQVEPVMAPSTWSDPAHATTVAAIADLIERIVRAADTSRDP